MTLPVSHAKALRAVIDDMRRTLRNSAPIGSGQTLTITNAGGGHVESWIAAIEAALALPFPDLRAYVQHKKECAKVTRETSDGHIVRLDPWEADKKPCTCDLDNKLAQLAALLGDPVRGPQDRRETP